MTPIERMARSLEGLSVGDAFGERFFYAPGHLPVRKTVPPPWEWTDDTAMAVELVAVLERCGEVDEALLADAFARRYAHEPDRGYGSVAHDILTQIHEGRPWKEASSAPYGGTGSMGNGGAMRAAPLGAFFADDPARLVREADRSAVVTHFHPEGRAGAVAVALAAGYFAREKSFDPRAYFAHVVELTPGGNVREGLRRAATLPLDSTLSEAVSLLGNGSRILAEDTAPLSVWLAARHPNDYEQALWSAAECLGDIDTVCAIVGGIITSGPATVPDEWRRAREPLPEPFAATR